MTRSGTTVSPFARIIAGALHRPVVRATWAGLRDAWWDLRAWRTLPQELPASPRTLLFVCQGNICRSPFAAERAQALLRAAGRTDITCVSAGYDPSQEAASPPHAVTVAARYGIDLSGHRPNGIVIAGQGADVVFVMEERQLELVARQAPQTAAQLRLLPAFRDRPIRGYRRRNIPDPYGQSLGTFERCYEEIDLAVRGLAARLGPPPSATRGE